jgi:hypothetical protein
MKIYFRGEIYITLMKMIIFVRVCFSLSRKTDPLTKSRVSSSVGTRLTAARCCTVIVVTVGYGKARRAHAAAAETWTGTAGEKGWGSRWDSAQVNPKLLRWCAAGSRGCGQRRRRGAAAGRRRGCRRALVGRCSVGVTSRPAEIARAMGFLGSVVDAVFFSETTEVNEAGGVHGGGGPLG